MDHLLTGDLHVEQGTVLALVDQAGSGQECRVEGTDNICPSKCQYSSTAEPSKESEYLHRNWVGAQGTWTDSGASQVEDIVSKTPASHGVAHLCASVGGVGSHVVPAQVTDVRDRRTWRDGGLCVHRYDSVSRVRYAVRCGGGRERGVRGKERRCIGERH